MQKRAARWTDPSTPGQRHIPPHATNLVGYSYAVEGHTQTAVKHLKLSMGWTVSHLVTTLQKTMATADQLQVCLYHNHELMYFSTFIFVNATHVWNKLAISGVQSPSLNSFKSKLLGHYLENIDFCT